MSSNTYTAWQPTKEIVGRVIVDRIEDSDDGLSIFIRLTKSDKKFRIVFDPYVAYRNMDESYRNRTFSEHGGFDNSLNKVENSLWLEWLHAESQGYYKGHEITHYTIITDADCIDVLSEFEPDIVTLN